MNRLEDTFLLKHILRFEGLDNWPSEVPVMSQVNEFIPFICQVPFDYLFRDDPAAMAECTLLVQEYLDLDELFGNLDIYNFEGESIGAAMGFYADHVPDFDRNNYLIRGEADLDLIRFRGLDSGRFPYLIAYAKAYQELARELLERNGQ